MKQGLFITLEGPDGAGKTTQLKFLAAKAQELGIETTTTREPGGTAIGDAVRTVLLNPDYQQMLPLTEVFLYAASRAQLMHETILPALERGELVICDRFVDSSLAYQVFAGGMDFDFVWEVNWAAIQGRLPVQTYVLDVSPTNSLARRSQANFDRMEQKPLSYHLKVRSGFLALAERFPERITVVDGTLPQEAVSALLWDKLRPRLEALR